MATVSDSALHKIIANARIKPFYTSFYYKRRYLDFETKMYDVLVIYKQVEMYFNQDGT